MEHEALVLLFRNRPTLAAEVLRDVLAVPLPRFSEARTEDIDFSQIVPTEYRADLVVLLAAGRVVYGIIVEAQLSIAEAKKFAWPVYATTLRSRLRCPTCVLVVTPDPAVARWAAPPIDLGPGGRFAPVVLGPEWIPAITDPEAACDSPELAVLSVLAHGRDAEATQVARAALAGIVGLDEERARLYYDLVLHALSDATRRAVEELMVGRYEYQSDFARKYFGEGKHEGRAEALVELAQAKFGAISSEIASRIRAGSAEQLQRWNVRILTAETVEQLFDS